MATTQAEHEVKLAVLAGELVDAAAAMSEAAPDGATPSDKYLESAQVVVETYRRWVEYRNSPWPPGSLDP